MRIISIADYNEKTMVLGGPVYDNKGRILLTAGRAIHPSILNRVVDIGINHLIVEDTESKGITLEEMLDMPTWVDAIQVLKNAFENLAAKKPFSLQSIQKITHKLISEVNKRKIIVLIPSTSIGNEMRLYAHLVNVAILSLQTAKHLGYSEIQLRDLALGVLLHDIGKLVTNDERKHPEEGFNILRNIREINLLSAHIALQHHESIDGTGYPRSLKGDKFLEFAQICGLSNLFENLIYDKGVSPHEAIEMVMAQNGVTYKESVVHAFIHSNPSYPPGTLIQLNSREKAIVTKIENNMQRPVIRIISTGKELSLVDHPSVTITGLAEYKQDVVSF